MTVIDLNVDLGEDCDTDEMSFTLVSSANITCGQHAGDVNTMRQTVGWALHQGVSIGTHPSFPDRENFDRTEMHPQPDGIYADVLFQTSGLSVIVRTQDGKLAHVKTHDALYNQASRDRSLAMTIVRAIRGFDPSLMVFGPMGGELAEAACKPGLQAKEEVFADHGYNADGSSVKYDTSGALTDSEDAAPNQTLTMMREQCVKAIDGTWVPIRAETACLHDNGAYALAFAQCIRGRFGSEGIAVRAGA